MSFAFGVFVLTRQYSNTPLIHVPDVVVVVTEDEQQQLIHDWSLESFSALSRTSSAVDLTRKCLRLLSRFAYPLTECLVSQSIPPTSLLSPSTAFLFSRTIDNSSGVSHSHT